MQLARIIVSKIRWLERAPRSPIVWAVLPALAGRQNWRRGVQKGKKAKTVILTHLDGSGGDFLISCPKKRDFQRILQVTRHQRLTAPGPPRKYVLTAKKGRFLGLLAGKQGFWGGQKATFFPLFHVLVGFFVCKSLSGKIFHKFQASEKNRAKKPTVGFIFAKSCGKITA